MPSTSPAILRGLPGALLCGLLCLPGCGDEKARSDGDLRPPDGGVGEGIKPPDLWLGDGALGPGNVGASCDPKAGGAGCSGNAACLAVTASVGVCAIPNCTLEDVTTPANEDTCPTVNVAGVATKTVCTAISVTAADGGYQLMHFCLPSCTAKAGSNACAAVNKTLTCDPLTILQNGTSEVCLLSACKNDLECGSKGPLDPNATCDVPTGTCHTKGTGGVKVGSPCKVSSECGPGQFCYPEQKDPKTGKTLVAGGYCTIVGCVHLGPWACPAGSECFALGSAKSVSLCLATGCDAAKNDCRPEAPSGQYACTKQADSVTVCWIDMASN